MPLREEEEEEERDEKTLQAEKKAESQRFNEVADLYDIYRPGYPVKLSEDILQLSGLNPDGSILELGSGTGIASLFFAQRGYSMLCLEPGHNMIEVASKKLAAYPNVRFEKARFEDWDAGDQRFDLIISAQAFHWIPEKVRFEKTARLLNPGGHLGLFWNMYVYPGVDLHIRKELDQVYYKYAPEFSKPDASVEQLIENRAASLQESPYYQNLVVKKYPWTERYTTEGYIGLLNTYSDHLGLPRQCRNLLYENVARVIDQNGGSLEKYYLAVLYVAQRTSV